MPRLMRDLDLDRVARVEIAERRNEGVHLRGGIDRIDDPPGVRAQHAALVGDADRRRPLPDEIDQTRHPPPREGVPAAAPDRAYVVVSGTRGLEEPADLLRRILQVGIERDDELSLGVLEPGEDRGMLAEVALEQHHARLPRAGLLLAAQQGHRSIAAPVIDEDALVRHLETVEGGIEPPEERRQRSLLIENGYDDAEGGAGSLHGGGVYSH
jgi:hypothetical protein